MWKTPTFNLLQVLTTTQYHDQNVLELFVKQIATQSMFKLPYSADSN